MRRSLDYFESHYEQTSIPQLYTCGLDESGCELIGRELGIAVRESDVASLLDVAEPLSAELQRLCLPAIGAALRRDPVVL